MIGIQTVDDVPEGVTSESESLRDANYWLSVARDAYSTSTDYFDANVRKQIEKNVQLFRSKHPSGSKYHTDAYRYRSKIFRPKIRASIRKSAAACAVAFFSTGDAVSIVANNDGDKRQQASAAINQELLQYRLDKSIPWFLTLVGALVDAKVQGVVISKQEWDYEEQVTPGDGVMGDQVHVVRDQPSIKLIPAENFRFSASSDWTDPVNSSPYLISLMPMFITDIKDRMVSGHWIEYSDGEILSAISDTTDTTRQARQGNRSDADQQAHQFNQFDLGFVREYIVNDQGRDVVFWTLGDTLMLTAPMPLEEVYHHGKRPFAIGYIDIEPHKSYPAGSPELGEGLQTLANDTVNQRLDNVKLVLNRRYFGKRGRSVDWDMLRRSVPGGVVMMDEFDSVMPEQIPDVTGSAYAEQDRVNMDFDEIMGAFSPSSVASNRKLNETVGGMNLLSGDANSMTEFELRVFSETWVEPVLRQLMLLEQTYENDQTILSIAGNRANLYQKFNIDAVTDDLLKAELTCRVNVGFGSTDPKSRIDKMAMGLQAIGTFTPQAMQRLDEEAVIAEVFGALGHKDGSRFFKPMGEGGGIPPQVQQQMQKMQDEIQKLRSGIEAATIRANATVQGKQIDAETRLQGHKMDLEARLQDSQMDRMAGAEQAHIRGQYAVKIAEMQAQLDGIRTRISAADSETKRGELRLQANALQYEIQAQEREMAHRIKEVNTGINQITPGKAQTVMNDNYGMVPHAVG